MPFKAQIIVSYLSSRTQAAESFSTTLTRILFSRKNQRNIFVLSYAMIIHKNYFPYTYSFTVMKNLLVQLRIARTRNFYPSEALCICHVCLSVHRYHTPKTVCLQILQVPKIIEFASEPNLSSEVI